MDGCRTRCGAESALSHGVAAALLGIGPLRIRTDRDLVPAHATYRPSGLRVHRRASLVSDRHDAAPWHPRYQPGLHVDRPRGPAGRDQLEAAINEADKLDLVDPEELRLRSTIFPAGLASRPAKDPRPPHVHPHGLGARAAVPADRPARGTPSARDRSPPERLQGRLLLARSRAGRRDRRTPLPPHARPAGARPRAGSVPYRRLASHPSLHPGPGPLRAGHVQATLAAVAGACALRSGT